MNIHSKERGTAGWIVTIEVPHAYTDGSSRFDRITIPYSKLDGKTPDQVRQAVKDALDDDPLAAVIGEEVAVPTPTKAIYEDRMVALYDDWQRWKATHAEAVERALAPAAVTALLNRTNAAWSAYVAAIQAWRVAP